MAHKTYSTLGKEANVGQQDRSAIGTLSDSQERDFTGHINSSLYAASQKRKGNHVCNNMLTRWQQKPTCFAQVT